MIHIFQVVGDPEKYEEKQFRIAGKNYISCLSSDALKKYLADEGREAKLTLLVPESLLLKENIDEFAERIKEKGIGDFEAVVIPSVGEFRVDGRSVEFKTGVETISTCIFLHLMKVKPEIVYVDVSTGQNIYPLSLLEATRRYLTYRKLERLLQGVTPVRAFKVFPPPIIKDVYSYPVEIQPVDVKAFFSLPNADIDNLVPKVPENFKSRIAEVNKRYSKLKKRVGQITEELRIAYNAIRLNVPLAFYELLSMHIPISEIERGMIGFVEELAEPVRTETSVERPVIDGVNVSNVFYSAALYSSIKEFKNSLNEAEVDEILQKFSELYRVKNLGVGVNEYFLLRDVEDIKSAVKNPKVKIEEGKEEILGRIKCGDNFHGSSINKRNFFAHSGFLQEYTVVKTVGNKIYVGWLKEKTKEIRNWLLNPDKD